MPASGRIGMSGRVQHVNGDGIGAASAVAEIPDQNQPPQLRQRCAMALENDKMHFDPDRDAWKRGYSKPHQIVSCPACAGATHSGEFTSSRIKFSNGYGGSNGGEPDRPGRNRVCWLSFSERLHALFLLSQPAGGCVATTPPVTF
jgi:hypothetical protein